MTDAQPQAKPKKKRKGLKILAGGIGAVVLIGILANLGGPDTSAPEGPTVTQIAEQPAEQNNAEPADDVPTEWRNALRQAGTYSDTMHMSKQGVYDQLVSEYGGQFPADAAQYAIDNVEADWNANALAKAKTYQETMGMSTAAIRDQLVSEHGEKFTPEQADYAIANL